MLTGTAAAFASIAVVRTPARAAQFELRCGSNYAPDHPVTAGLKNMWASVEKETGGRVRVLFFPNSQLGGDTAMLTQLRSGALHFETINSGILQSVVPAAGINGIGFAFGSEAIACSAFDGPLGDYVRKEVAAKNLYCFRKIWNSGMREVTSSVRPIKTPDDLNGFKIRTPEAKLFVDLFKALGANPTPINFNEVYTALQTKVVDGQETPLVTIEVSRLFEVQKYLSMTNHLWAGDWLIANADTWASLGPELQGIIERNNTKYALLERQASMAQNAALAGKLTAQGLTINTTDPAQFRARLGTFYSYWSKEFGPTLWGLLEEGVGVKLA